ncbi:hypothetical protein SEVIR_7G132300v4 [Setaria viridis]|uniref:Uncharacterized protein n=2 Tax=Setaria TaxID=4554 RepID=K3YCK7_SETIT|nr:hypothetical protein SETIT_7G124000v2 [Setaria italica]TKW04787.1 hypothetical protein SEVIR_7G132300v2 [Setaria viridis]
MRVLRLAVLAVLVLAALLSSGPVEVRGVRVPAAVLATGQTGTRSASMPPEQRTTRTPAAGGSRAAAASGASASLDASKEGAAGGGSPPSTVFDPDRMSKRRVRRGSDPIHNKC